MCQVEDPVEIDDGTMCLAAMPRPIPVCSTHQVLTAQSAAPARFAYEDDGNGGLCSAELNQHALPHTYSAVHDMVTSARRIWNLATGGGVPVVIYRLSWMEIDEDGGWDTYHPPDPAHPHGKGQGLGRDDLRNATSNIRIAYNPHNPNALVGGHPWDHTKNTHWCALVIDPATSRPFVQRAGDPFPGFYVSKTSLFDPDAKAHPENPRNYVDAARIPFLVRHTPIERQGVALGDFAAVVKNGSTPTVAFAIVADQGPSKGHLGEGSRALHVALGNHGKGGIGSRDLIYIFFKKSHRTPPWKAGTSADDVVRSAQYLFNRWGGLARVQQLFPVAPKKRK
jgi:hypothetical protein